ncbi:hypothetical protein T08_14664 [Trichinella sp. T8]|nr:hypothetical protein T08_14664 [Trichinella sp. T8]
MTRLSSSQVQLVMPRDCLMVLRHHAAVWNHAAPDECPLWARTSDGRCAGSSANQASSTANPHQLKTHHLEGVASFHHFGQPVDVNSIAARRRTYLTTLYRSARLCSRGAAHVPHHQHCQEWRAREADPTRVSRLFMRRT